MKFRGFRQSAMLSGSGFTPRQQCIGKSYPTGPLNVKPLLLTKVEVLCIGTWCQPTSQCTKHCSVLWILWDKWCYMYNFQCTFILTFYHGVPKIPQEFWHRWDLSSDILDATVLLPPPSSSSLLRSCCLSACSCVLEMLALPQHPVSNAKGKERESW